MAPGVFLFPKSGRRYHTSAYMESPIDFNRLESTDFFNTTGYPLGSGGIESSNKCIGHVRLKRSGAWWYEANSNHMLALHCVKYNGTLDQVFKRCQQRLRETSE